MNELLRKLRRRKLVQWALAYVAAAFALIQVTDVVAQQFDWGDSVRRGITIALAVGFLVELVLAWYHGEKGAQRFSGTELIIIALLLAAGGGAVWWLAPKAGDASRPAPNAATAAAPADRKSIAVLPFANLSSDKENNYFADGMRDMILTKLATIGELKVISRTSTDKYGNHPEDLKKVALQLGVASVLEGSVQKSGNQVLINLQLISANNDQHLWAEAYKRTVDDVFGVEGEIAQIVAEALNAKLSDAEQKSVADKPTTNPEAFDLFLRAEQARYEGEKGQNPIALGEAVKLYEQAVAKDAKFALAWAEMSRSRAIRYWYGDVEKGQLAEYARLVQQNAEQALALQPGLSEANLAMGFYHYYVRLDLAQALVSFEAALRAKPNDSRVLYALGLITRRLNRFEESLDHLRAANRLDPRNQVVSGALITTLALTRHYSAAVQICERALALDPSNEDALVSAAFMKVALRDDLEGAQAQMQGVPPSVQVVRADLLSWLKRFDEAIALVESIPDTPENFFSGHVDTKSRVLGTYYLDSGRADAARPLLLDAREKFEAANTEMPDDHVSAAETRLQLAYVVALLGDPAAAARLADQALKLPATLPDKNYLGWVDVAGSAVRVYARAHRADLAVPLLAKLLSSPGTGFVVSYAAMRLDPDFDPIRSDPAFQSLVQAHPGSGDVPE
jgi:TolB-like protein/Tfp pilus assembly protein PilF